MLYRFTLAKYRLWPGKGVTEQRPLDAVLLAFWARNWVAQIRANVAKAGVPLIRIWACPAISSLSSSAEGVR
jgi:hypothetical protein